MFEITLQVSEFEEEPLVESMLWYIRPRGGCVGRDWYKNPVTNITILKCRKWYSNPVTYTGIGGH